MKRLLLLKTAITTVLASFAFTAAIAQSNLAIMGPRLMVDAPSSVSGLKKFTYSSSGTGAWGRALDSIWQHVEIVRTNGDTLGCTNNNAYAGKWALIWRGNCQFGEKALYAQQKGAKGVIIINNVSGQDPVGMAAGTSGGSVTIPVLMVGNADGAALWDALGSSQQYISLTLWGFNLGNDLSIVPNSPAPGPGVIPYKQWAAGTPPANYKYFSGIYIANTGTNAQTGVKIFVNIDWTPTGGSPTNVYKDTMSLTGTFNTTDSIFEVLSANTGVLNPTSTGRFNITYTVAGSTTDDNPGDNTWTLYCDVKDNIFSKARVDANNNPMITGGVRPGTATNYSWGPLLYNVQGGYQARFVRFAYSDGDTSKHSLAGSLASAYIWKWVDGSGGGSVDNYMQPKEMSLIGLAYKELTAADSPGRVFIAPVGNKDGSAGVITLESNSWYWVAADMDQNLFLSVDEGYNYYNRSNAAKHATTPVTDFWAPIYLGSKTAMDGKPSDTVRLIPFGYSGGSPNSNNIDSAAINFVDNTTPSIVLEMSPFQVAVENTKAEPSQMAVYPNPTTDVINVKLSLLNNASKAHIRIIDAVGRTMYKTEKENVQNDIISLSTKGFAPGNYYVVVMANGYGLNRPFTVTKQ